MLGLLQVGEFSSIIGLIKRAETVYGGLFTVSGVMCAFRKRALHEAGWWSPETVTDDVEVSWRLQLAGWRLVYESKAICWIPHARNPQGTLAAAPPVVGRRH